MEFLIFDEEVLLALCFVSFIFFAYHSLGNTVYAGLSEMTESYLLILQTNNSLKQEMFVTTFSNSKSYGKFLILNSLVFSLTTGLASVLKNSETYAFTSLGLNRLDVFINSFKTIEFNSLLHWRFISLQIIGFKALINISTTSSSINNKQFYVAQNSDSELLYI